MFIFLLYFFTHIGILNTSIRPSSKFTYGVHSKLSNNNNRFNTPSHLTFRLAVSSQHLVGPISSSKRQVVCCVQPLEVSSSVSAAYSTTMSTSIASSQTNFQRDTIRGGLCTWPSSPIGLVRQPDDQRVTSIRITLLHIDLIFNELQSRYVTLVCPTNSPILFNSHLQLSLIGKLFRLTATFFKNKLLKTR